MSNDHSNQRRLVLYVLRRCGPLIDQEIENITGLSGNTLRWRRRELIKAERVRWAGGMRKTRAGVAAKLWAVVK